MRPSISEHSDSELTKGQECIGEGGGLQTEECVAEPLVQHGAVAKQAFKQRLQRPKIEQAFRDVKDKHARRSIQRPSPDQCRFEKGGHCGGADPGKDGTATDIIEITHNAAPFEGVICRRCADPD
jgi:hypothetical protein